MVPLRPYSSGSHATSKSSTLWSRSIFTDINGLRPENTRTSSLAVPVAEVSAGSLPATADRDAFGSGKAPDPRAFSGEPEAPRAALGSVVVDDSGLVWPCGATPRRGGLSASLNEIARASGVGIDLIEKDLPIPQMVRDACGLLGLDALQVANEGKLVAIVAADEADMVLEAMQAHPLGRGSCQVGTCVPEHPRMVVAKTGMGGTRVVDLPIGEQLPRIC